MIFMCDLPFRLLPWGAGKCRVCGREVFDFEKVCDKCLREYAEIDRAELEEDVVI